MQTIFLQQQQQNQRTHTHAHNIAAQDDQQQLKR